MMLEPAPKVANIYWDLSPEELIQEALLRGEGHLSDTGALVMVTGKRTGRSPADRFIVDEPSTSERIAWGKVNRPFSLEQFDALWERVENTFDQGSQFHAELHVGADDEHYVPVKVLTEKAWSALFARNMFITPKKSTVSPASPTLAEQCMGNTAFSGKR